MIIKCNCKGKRTPAMDYQDRTYGVGMRVHNDCHPIENKVQVGARCSCCGDVKRVK